MSSLRFPSRKEVGNAQFYLTTNTKAGSQQIRLKKPTRCYNTCFILIKTSTVCVGIIKNKTPFLGNRKFDIWTLKIIKNFKLQIRTPLTFLLNLV